MPRKGAVLDGYSTPPLPPAQAQQLIDSAKPSLKCRPWQPNTVYCWSSSEIARWIFDNPGYGYALGCYWTIWYKHVHHDVFVVKFLPSKDLLDV